MSPIIEIAETPDAAFAEYANVIWEAWCKKRGSDLPDISNVEFMEIRGWRERGVPLRIVLRAFLDIVKVPHERTTLRYACRAVDETFRHWQTNMTL